MERTTKKNFLIDFAYVVSILFLVYFIGKFFLQYLLPFIFATIIAFAMQKPSYYLSRKFKIKQGILAAVLSGAVYLIAGFLIGFLIYRLILLFIDFKDYLPQLFEKFNNILIRFESIFETMPENFNVSGLIDNVISKVTLNIGGFISNLAKNMPSFFLSSIVAFVATCYIAKDFKGLSKFVKEICGRKITENVLKIKKILFESVFKLIKGYLILSLLTYIELTVGLLILKVKFAPLIAVLIATVDLLPVIGAGTVMVPWAVITAFLGNYGLGIGIVVLYLVVLLLRNFAEPKIIAGQIGINPLFTLLAMFVGLKLIGFLGLILFPIILIVVIRYYRDEDNQGLSY